MRKNDASETILRNQQKNFKNLTRIEKRMMIDDIDMIINTDLILKNMQVKINNICKTRK